MLCHNLLFIAANLHRRDPFSAGAVLHDRNPWENEEGLQSYEGKHVFHGPSRWAVALFTTQPQVDDEDLDSWSFCCLTLLKQMVGTSFFPRIL